MATPEEIGPYRIVRPLGQGGMGAVYLAQDTRLHRQVALKLFTGGNARGELARYELLNEARAAAALNHPHIASVHDVLDVDGQVAIVFEYVQGETLADRLERGRLDTKETIDLTLQLVEALSAAHQRGIVHRDLKPANIAIAADGNVKVLDFGVARVMPGGVDNPGSAQTTIACFVGTVGYAAPEQCLGQSVDARADIFSLGVLMFEMLTRRRPFNGIDASVVLRSMLNEAPPRITSLAPGVPQELEELVTRMLAPDPARRPDTVRRVGMVLRGLLPTQRGDEIRPAPSRRSWTIAALLAAAVVTGALVSPLLVERGTPFETPVSARSPVVAVMPLTNASGDPAKDYVATGVAENLVTQLAGVPSITVLSRAAVNDAQSRNKDVASLALELDATYLVDGSVQLSGERLRIDLRLVDPNGSVAWADNVEGDFDDVFDLQRQLTAAVAQALSVRLSAADRASFAQQLTANPEALAAYWRGRALLDRRDIKGNTTAALAAFDEAVSLDASFADAHAGRGEALWSLYAESRDSGQARAASEAATAALRLNPNRPEVRYTLAVILAGTGQPDAAIEELQRALALRPLFEDARIQLGLVLSRQGRIDEAIGEFRRVTDARPNYARPFATMGVALFEAGRYAEAARSFERVTELQPENVIAYQQVGASYHELGDLKQAMLFYERAIAVSPYAPAYSNIGTIYYRNREYEKAADSYQKAISLRPNFRETHRNLGDAYSKLGREVDARRAYLEAVRRAEADLTVNPRDPRALAALAVYLQKLQKTSEATHRLEQAMSIAQGDIQVLRRAAQVHALAKRPEAALHALDGALANG